MPPLRTDHLLRVLGQRQPAQEGLHGVHGQERLGVAGVLGASSLLQRPERLTGRVVDDGLVGQLSSAARAGWIWPMTPSSRANSATRAGSEPGRVR